MQTSATTPPSFSTAGIIWIKIAMVYLLVGIALGIGMGATQNFALAPVHAHVNLLGWATMGLAGLIYCVFPQAGQSKLAKAHFWLSNISQPIMLASLSALMLGHAGVVPLLSIAEIVAAIGIVAFALNVYLNLKRD